MHMFAIKPKAPQQIQSVKAPGCTLSGQSSDVDSLLTLQRSIDNKGVTRLLQPETEDLETSSANNAMIGIAHDFIRIPVHTGKHCNVQPKVKVNAPGDKYEEEADRVADQLLRQPIPVEKDGTVNIRARPLLPASEGQREVHAEFENRLRHNKGGGQPIPDSIRALVEPCVKYDFSNIQLHRDNSAALMNQALGARAFTLGRDIYFGFGQYVPQSTEGKRLLLHELTHVIQQTGGVPSDTAVNAHQGGKKTSARGVHPHEFQFIPVVQAIQQTTRGGVVQLAQHPAAARQSRVMVATSTQSFLTSYSRQLTQRLLLQLRDQRRSVAAAVSTTSEGTRTFGARSAAAAIEPGRIDLGMPAEETGTPMRRAVVVGNGSYDQNATMGSSVLPLQGRDIATAVSDAATIAATLQGRGYDVGSFHQDNQTAAQIDGLLQAGLSGLRAGDELLFYYHGHGTMEGLIGQDGSVFTPVQMATIRSAARGTGINLTLVLEGCHTGVFADAIRGSELRDTLGAMRARIGLTSGVVRYACQLLLPVLDNAIAIQGLKDAFNTRTQAWWTRRYQIEQQMEASPGDATVIATWDNHYQSLQGIWNDLVTAVTPLLSTMRTNAIAAGFNVELSPQITPLSGSFNQNGEYAIQAGLDDLDTILNRVLRETDSRLR